MPGSRTQVAIIGAGPAGLLLGRMLEQAGIEAVVLEARSRAYVEQRQRAGILEQTTIDLLAAAGVSDRMCAEGFFHDGIELLNDGRAQRIDFVELCGRRVALWPQTEVVKDLIQARIRTNAPLYFEASDVQLDVAAPSITFTHEGATEQLDCDVIAGCDGFHGVCRGALEPDEVTTRDYPFAWLGILAHVPPSCDELIYANHPRGFALHSMRTAQISRLYLQVAADEQLEHWSDDRIWEELSLRLGRDGWTLATGEIFDKSITPMRSFVATPMRRGNLFLAGDAAHIVPPTGAKGLNLAAADVAVLAEALIDYCANGRRTGIDEYSDRVLRRVWRAEHFSWWMTSMLHRFPDHDAFDRALQQSQLDYLFRSEAARATLAENYTGMPL